MKLSALLKDHASIPSALGEREISAIHYRSQDVVPKGLFVAIRGQKADGHDFVGDVARRGAAAVIVDRDGFPQQIGQTLIIPVGDSRLTLSLLSARFYGHCSRELVTIGITGTNGKTTTAYLIENILRQAGFSVGVIGTVNYRFAGKIFPNPMTTPESADLQRILWEMKRSGVTHVVMEVSSHAIDLQRIAHCEFDVGVFTNLSQDHLDYHRTMDNYWSCKKAFFTSILPAVSQGRQPIAVINHDDPRGERLGKTLAAVPVISTGRDTANRIHPKDIEMNMSGISGVIQTPCGGFAFHSGMVGNYNLENILNAVGAASTLKIPLEIIRRGIECFKGVPGRLETVPDSCGRFVFVDYAHTPDALENVLATLKRTPLHIGNSTGRLICVFGCGGDRDRQKRPLMGEIAARYCDLAVVTSDNPRTESPLRIMEHIIRGIHPDRCHRYTPQHLREEIGDKGFVAEPDRKKAIELAITVSSPGDTILIAGKGHENHQIIGNRTIDFDDRQEARNAIEILRSGREIPGAYA